MSLTIKEEARNPVTHHSEKTYVVNKTFGRK
ncbi:hypothetical protein YPF_3333 [Yersinia pestis biovar Orientalis str. India 195]|nr:hypothetical protein YP516_2451 [Yersinia pestis Nepal516]EEO80510.1 hypothetical protein YPF_3333 [Yersinia pestis biovar Orientalis str. India 195]